MSMALSAGYAAYRRAWSDPESQHLAATFSSRQAYYRLLHSHYANTIFEGLAAWGGYKAQHGLYRQTRAIYSPVHRLCEQYAGTIYPGVLSEDGKDLPDGVAMAIPLAEDTNPALKLAISQTWQWSNWQQAKSLYVRMGAMLGSVLVEIRDQPTHGKVSYEVIWPGYVPAITLDSAGNVKAYTQEFTATDERGQRYRFRKESDSESFRTFKDDKPFDYDPESGQGAEWENPYGFVPAVWVRHKLIGSDFGAPAIDGSLGKIDELNSLASHLADQAHKVINAPWLFSGNVSLANVGATAKRGATDEFSDGGEDRSDRESILWLQGPEGTTATSLAGNLPFADVLKQVQDIQAEIENDHPELIMWKQLRGMREVTGPGAARLMGDAAANIFEAGAAYDRGSIALFQMAVAIAGWRISNGWRGPLTRQQQKFAPFDLTSYQKGQLDFSIMARPIVAPTQRERADESLARALAAEAWGRAGMGLETYLVREEGWSAEDVAALGQARLEEIKRQQILALDDMPEDAIGVAQ